MKEETETLEFIHPRKDEKTTTLKKSILHKLENLGNMNSSYDDVIQELLEHCDKCDQYWENRT